MKTIQFLICHFKSIHQPFKNQQAMKIVWTFPSSWKLPWTNQIGFSFWNQTLTLTHWKTQYMVRSLKFKSKFSGVMTDGLIVEKKSSVNLLPGRTFYLVFLMPPVLGPYHFSQTIIAIWNQFFRRKYLKSKVTIAHTNKFKKWPLQLKLCNLKKYAINRYYRTAIKRPPSGSVLRPIPRDGR